MASINTVVISGNLGQDPDLKYTQSGTAICNFSVAVNEYRKDKDSGESTQTTHWLRCCAFNRTAEVMAEYLHKGSKVTISGRLSTRQYEKDGVTHNVVEIIVRDLDLPPKGNNGDSQTKSKPPAKKQSNQEPDFPDPDEEMPF